jgi:cytochrome c
MLAWAVTGANMRKVLAALGLVVLLAACGKSEKKTEAPANPELMEQGEAAFVRRCSTCHSLLGDNRAGPDLSGLRGRKAGTVKGFAYSEAMRNSGIVWSADTLDRYLQGPQAMVPGTMMQIDPITDPEERAAVIEYLLHQ